MKNKFYTWLALIAISSSAAFWGSCKKTESLPRLPQNQILEYKITNTNQGDILGAVDNVDKTITIYVPFYYGLDVIVPAIQVSQGARLEKPVAPVPILSDTTTYKVIGADNSSSIYKLKIVIQQETPLKLVDVVAYSPLDGNVFTVAGGITVVGNFNTLNYNLVKVFLVTSNEQELSLTVDPTNVSAYTSDNGYVMGPYTIPNTLDSGIYRLRVKLNGASADWPTPLHLTYAKTKLAYGNFTLKKGDSFTVSATLFSMIQDIQNVSFTYGGSTYLLQLVSQDRKSAVIKVPDDFPVGTYSYGIGTLNFNFKNGTKSSTTIGMTVNSK